MITLPLTPEYGALLALRAKERVLGGKGSGNFGHEGRPGERGGSSTTEGTNALDHVRSEKSQRALQAFVPADAKAQRHAESNELKIRRMIGGIRTDDNAPVDNVVTLEGRTKGIEVKTMVNNTNDKITMRADALERKQNWARSNKASLHTIVIDDRGRLGSPGYSGHRIYYAKGVGSFRLSGMTPVKNAEHLKSLLTGKAYRGLGGEGSGNWGHSGRPGEVGGSSSDTSFTPVTGWTRVGEQLGSNKGGQYKTPSGEKKYVKFYHKDEQARSELASQRVHKAAGVLVPQGQLVHLDGKDAIANDWMVSKSLSGSEMEALLAQDPEYAGKIFAASVATQNWDVAGTGFDNIVKTSEGKLAVVDVGGSFRYRAQGGLRPFSTKASEVSTLLDKSVNSWSAKAFGKAMKDPVAQESALRTFTKLLSIDPHAPGVSRAEWEAKIEDAISRTKTLRTLGGEGSGNFGHAGRPGEVGGSSAEGGEKSEKKEKQKHTKEQVAQALQMKKDGKTMKQIQQATGLHPSTQIYYNQKVAKQEAKIKQALEAQQAPKAAPATATPATPTSTSTSTTPTADEAKKYGYEWKEKLSGPNAGKYAFFKDGVQVSSPHSKENIELAAKSIDQGTGPKAPYVPTPSPTGWPVSNDVVRKMGQNYPNEVKAKYSEWVNTLSVTEKANIGSYTGSGYASINQSLHAGKELSTSGNYIQKALERAPTPPPPDLVWRGISYDTSFVSGLAKGDTIQLKGFQSTSINPNFASSWGSKALLEIRPSKGAYVAHISSSGSSEREFLLPHNAKYTVEGITTIKIASSPHDDYEHTEKTRKVIQLRMH